MFNKERWNKMKDILAPRRKVKVLRGKNDHVPANLSSDLCGDENDNDFHSDVLQPLQEDEYSALNRKNERPLSVRDDSRKKG